MKCSLRLLMVAGLAALLTDHGSAEETQPLATPQQMAASTKDLWGEAAIARPEGPTYEFFRDLLPPLRYVNTEFKHYPIVLSAPAGAIKARWVSSGGGVNLRANKPPMWREIGTPVQFFLGEGAHRFGQDIAKITGPKYAGGHLPIVQVGYEHAGCRYEQEAFALVGKEWAEHGAVFVKFTCRDQAGKIIVAMPQDIKIRAGNGILLNDKAEALLYFDQRWMWDEPSHQLRAPLADGDSTTILVPTKPVPGIYVRERSQPKAFAGPALSFPSYEKERKSCQEAWTGILRRGAQFSLPEPIVQDAWQSLVVGNYLLASGDRMNYSAGNAYDHLYEGECGDAVKSLLLFGQAADARRMVGPLLDFNRQATRFHVAGHKLQLLAYYYWLTRDADYIREKRPVWAPVVDFIRTSRKTENGLLPKDNYAGDVNTQIYSLNSNANCWRGVRDMSAVLEEVGDRTLAAELRQEADGFRKVILDAVAKSERRETTPPFIPLSLYGDEPAHDPLTATRMGSYYDLMAPYVLGSGVFGLGDQHETWLIEYLRQHGGLAMGMIRSMPHQGEFKDDPGVNVLYGQRYMLALLRRGDRGHALAGFYGHLAQGMTRETFIGGEGSRFFHGDANGRSFYLPPNSASNAMFLTTLRYLLIQDWDSDDDGRPDTLRLLDAIPAAWLKDGSKIVVEKAPSAFGDVSFRAESRLEKGEIVLVLTAPSRTPAHWTVRLPTIPGYTVVGAEIDRKELRRDDAGRYHLTGRTGEFTIHIEVQRSAR